MSEKTKRIVIKTEPPEPELEITQMVDASDDAEYFAFQARNRRHFERFGNTVYDTPEAVTKSRIEKGGRRFGIRKDGKLIRGVR